MQRQGRLILPACAMAGVVILSLFAWQANKGFSLWDEGFLWYGVQRVLTGEVPIRDFMAYDPGRYYWSALVLQLWGDAGIIPLRASLALFQFVGLSAGLWLIGKSLPASNRSLTYWLFLLLAAVTLVLWMYPRHKLFDVSLSMVMVAALAILIEHPGRRTHFFTGIAVGLIAVFGRNHGVYAVFGSLAVMLWLALQPAERGGREPANWLCWAAGIALGFSPIVLMALAIPGFGAAFWESVRFLFDIKSTNLPLPVPWPWAVDLSNASLVEAVRRVLIGTLFLALLLFAIGGLVWAFSKRGRSTTAKPALIAAICMTLPYAHFAFSRADVSHLSKGIFPFLLAILVLIAAARPVIKWASMGAVLVVSALVMFPVQPGGDCVWGQPCKTIEVSGSTLLVDSGTAADVALLRELRRNHPGEDNAFLAAPFWPGAYALFNKKSPIWEIYALFPRSQQFEEEEVQRIKNAKPGFVIILDLPLDMREELRFRNTHPLTHRYIVENFDRLPESPNPAYQIYKARGH